MKKTFVVPMQAFVVTQFSPKWLTGHRELYESLLRHLLANGGKV